MYNISNKAIIIAVGLIVTIAITSSVVMVMGYFKDIYSDVKNTDISLRKMFNKFDPYDNTDVTGIDIINAYKKYRNDPTVSIIVYNTEVNNVNLIRLIDETKYAKEYTATCVRIDDGARITFNEK